MRQYKPGDEILPGVVCTEVDTRHEVLPYRFQIAGGENLWRTPRTIEALEAIADELADLRARVPSEWRTGVPDWENLNPVDLIVRRDATTKEHLGNGNVGWYSERRKSFDDWDTVEWLLIEFAPPAPEKPKPLTVADLPDFGGRVEWHLSTRSDDERCYAVATNGRYRWVDMNCYLTEADAIAAALEAVAAGKLDRWLGGAE